MLKHDRRATSGDDEQIAKLFREELARFESWIKRQANFRMLEVDYNRLLQSPAEPTELVTGWLEKTRDTGAMIQVIDPALYRNRR